ncbi:MAG: response regulator [bacterium]|nr:response regulator [bacterium]
MDTFNNFKAMSFPEQIMVLTEIGHKKDIRDLPELFFMYDLLTGDKTIDAMVEHTLRDILSDNETETVKRLDNGSVKEKKLSLNIAGNKHFDSAVFPIIQMLEKETDEEVLMQAYIAMAEMQNPHFMEVFRRTIHHPNEILSGISIEMAALYNDVESIDDLEKVVLESESGQNYETCTVRLAKAIESLARLGKNNPGCIGFLVVHVHHKNPTARRLIHEELQALGLEAIPFFKACFPHQTTDERIQSVDIIGSIGKKEAGEILIDAIDNGWADTPNIKIAVYEALGKTPSDKSIAYLCNALADESDQALMTIINAMEQMGDPAAGYAVGYTVSVLVEKNDEHAREIMQCIVETMAVKLFQYLYTKGSKKLKGALIDTVFKTENPVISKVFADTLQEIAAEANSPGVQTLRDRPPQKAHYRVLAVDDSRAMRLFYSSLISSSSVETTQAENGQDAWARMEGGEQFDLIITDMNMPVMDGIEFTRKVRAKNAYAVIPIIMGTTESHSSQVDLAKKCGVTDIFFKPIAREALKAKINSYLG